MKRTVFVKLEATQIRELVKQISPASRLRIADFHTREEAVDFIQRELDVSWNKASKILDASGIAFTRHRGAPEVNKRGTR